MYSTLILRASFSESEVVVASEQMGVFKLRHGM